MAFSSLPFCSLSWQLIRVNLYLSKFARPVQVACFAFPLLGGVSLQAADWPQFRGPNRDAVWNETGLLKSFPLGGLKVRWRKPVGWGWSSPVIAQGRVFLTDSELSHPWAKERIRCFEETTGKSLWSYAYEGAHSEWAFSLEHGGGPASTPIAEGGKVYMLGGSGHVHCLDARTGALLWENNLGREYEIRELNCRTSPLIEGNHLILLAGAKPGACVLALDKKTGKEVWKALAESISNSSPIIIKAGGKRQLIVWTGESVTSLDPATGAPYWREPITTSTNDSIPAPVLENNRLLISGLMLELDAHQPSAKVLWPESKAFSKRILSNTSTPLLQGGYVYSAKSSGELVCLDAATGNQIWHTNTVTGLTTGASIHLTANRDRVFLFTDQGDLILAQLTPQGYDEISRARLLAPTSPFGSRKFAWTPPSYANRHVFARNDEELVCASLAAMP